MSENWYPQNSIQICKNQNALNYTFVSQRSYTKKLVQVRFTSATWGDTC